MVTATMFQAKTNLSELVKKAQAGEEVIITSGREKKPVVRLTPIEPAAPAGRLGFLEHLGIEVPDHFWDPLPEDELRLWEGGED